MPYEYTLTTVIPASAQEIYDAWLDSIAHSEMTGGKAKMTSEIGADVSAWNKYITGRNLALVPGERIVQAWRTTHFTDEHEDSIVTVVLNEVDDGTLLTLVHSNVPDEQRSYEEGGWHKHYFEPMKKYFDKSKRAQEAKKATVSARRPKTKQKRKVSKAKSTAGRKKPKHVVSAKAKVKRAKAGKKKTRRGKR